MEQIVNTCTLKLKKLPQSFTSELMVKVQLAPELTHCRTFDYPLNFWFKKTNDF